MSLPESASGGSPPTAHPTTVVALMRGHVAIRPDDIAYTFVTAQSESVAWTYRDLDVRTRAIAAHLQERDQRGRPVLILQPPGLEFVAAFLGCLYAGAIAVPAYPPDHRRFNQWVPRLSAIVADTRGEMVLTSAFVRDLTSTQRANVAAPGLDDLTWLATDEIPDIDAEAWTTDIVGTGALALLQYTSGSTSAPKGVMVSNENLLANLRSIHLRLEHGQESGLVSWLPPYHDMGLIGGILTPLYGGIPAWLMSPDTFVTDPRLWLATLSDSGACTSVAPNFGFEHCLQRISADNLEGLDLRHWRCALNGSEPVRANTLSRFVERFGPVGFNERAFMPCYGLAEATLMVTGVRAPEAPAVIECSGNELAAGRLVPDAGAKGCTTLVECGPPVPDVAVSVVEPQTQRRCAEGEVGEIWVAGPNVARGYWRRPEESAVNFRASIAGEDGTWLRTGDLGCLRDGSLYVVGRGKDVVVVQGRNIHPHDVEATAAAASAALRAGHGAAFAVEVDGAEELALVYEYDNRGTTDPLTELACVRAAIVREHQVSPHVVALVDRGAIVRTTSGKIARQACRAKFHQLGFTVLAASVRDESQPVRPQKSATRADIVDAIRRISGHAGITGVSFTDLGLDYLRLRELAKELARFELAGAGVGELLVSGSVDELLAAVSDTLPGNEHPASPPVTAAASVVEIERWLLQEVAHCIGLPETTIDASRAFSDLGLDSRQVAAIADRLGAWLGRTIAVSQFYDSPNIHAVAAALGPTPAIRAEIPDADSADLHRPQPLAIVGIGVRLPGARGVDSFWELLRDGRDATSEVPTWRWDTEAVDAPRRAGLIDRPEEFDARFFGISAREAQSMDPQHRLLLEVVWEALEDAGIAPTALAGSATGVFIGISSSDYAQRTLINTDAPDAHAVTGSSHAVAANRLSYVLDLRGPSMALDTACSSSLVAVHQAGHSLRAGECELALVGGVNMLLSPSLSNALHRAGMLAVDGRSRPFDTRARGYVRAEGAAVVCLKTAERALADGDRIYALLLGSAVGHGGRGNGLTAPRAVAQRAVINDALNNGGVQPNAVRYVEVHGTGTERGDPIEWEALTAIYGRTASEPCYVGSVKANIGHLEAAAGIAGLIKAALVVRNGEIPPQVNLDQINERLDLRAGLEVPTVPKPLPGESEARVAVSSFGFGGANAHVVLARPAPAPLEPPSSRPDRKTHALCLSAHSPTALAELARRYRIRLAARPEEAVADIAFSAATTRAHLSCRAVVCGDDRPGLDAGLAALMARDEIDSVITGDTTGARRPRVAFLFSGQGSQRIGMGHTLYRTDAGFAASIDRYAAVLRPLIDVPLPELLFDPDQADRLRRTRYCQPALVACELALAELWARIGVHPVAVLGHSVGAITAAAFAGALSAEDALVLAAERGKCMDEQPGDGAMLACITDVVTAERVAADRGVSVAAENSLSSYVLSGPDAAITQARDDLTRLGVSTQPLSVSHAFHSAMMIGAADKLLAAASQVDAAAPKTTWISDATGTPNGVVTVDYWVEHMLGRVRFNAGVETLLDLGCDAFVEVGPHPTLIPFARQTAAARESTARLWVPTLHRAADDWTVLLKSVAHLHCAGAEIDWAALEHERRRRRVNVPHTVFERERYWIDTPRSSRPQVVSGTPEPHKDTNYDHATQFSVAKLVEVAPDALALNGNTHQDNGLATNGVAPDRLEVATAARDVVIGHVSAVCGFPISQLHSAARLGEDLGFDSLMKTELMRRIAGDIPDGIEGLRTAMAGDPSLTEVIDFVGRHRVANTATIASALTRPAIEASPVRPTVAPDRRFEDWAEYRELKARLRQITVSGTNPYGRSHDGYNSARVRVNGRELLNFSAFDYLGLAHHPRVRAAAQQAIERYGTSCSATPLLCGETSLHHELAAAIASFLGTDAAIVFAGGHATNVATIGHLLGPDDLVLHDEWSHDSSVRGAILSGARRLPFPHNDWAALDEMLNLLRAGHRRTLVLIEGCYSQDGDLPDLPEFIRIKKRHDAMLMVDEAHSIGVLGRTGRGIGEHFGVDRAEVDLWMGTLSKALGSLGGYVAASAPVVELLTYTAPLYIFSTGISPANAAAALEAIRVVDQEPQRVGQLQARAEHFRVGARARGLDVGVSEASAVIPVIVGDWGHAMRLSNDLLASGVNVMPIGYPAVPEDACRLRFFVNVDHAEADLDHTLDLLRTSRHD